MSRSQLVAVLLLAAGAALLTTRRVGAQIPHVKPKPFICTSNCPTYPPSIQITPANGTSASGSLNVTVTLCDSIGNPSGTVTFNGTNVTSSFNFASGSSSPGCHFKLTASASLTLNTGANSFAVSATEFFSGNTWTANANFTYYGIGYNDAIAANPATFNQNANTSGSASFNVTNTGYPTDTFKITYTCTAHAITRCGPASTDSLVIGANAQGTATVGFAAGNVDGVDTITATAQRYTSPTVAHSATAVVTTINGTDPCGSGPDTLTTCNPSIANAYAGTVDTVTVNLKHAKGAVGDSAGYEQFYTSCTTTGVLSNCSTSPDPGEVLQGSYKTIRLIYSVGTVGGTGSVNLVSQGNYDVSTTYTIKSLDPIRVTPKSTTASVSGLASDTIAFVVTDSGASDQFMRYTAICTWGGSTIPCTASPIPQFLAHDSSVTVRVVFKAGAAGTSGSIKLAGYDSFTASYTDTGSVTTNAVIGKYLAVNTTYTNQDDQDAGRCALNCFAATAQITTATYTANSLPHGVTLIYNGDNVAVRPFIYADVLNVGGYPLTSLQMQVQLYNGSAKAWTTVTFLNGDQTLWFNGAPLNGATVPHRLAGQFDASTYQTNAGETAVYPMRITVTGTYGDGHTEQFIDSTRHLMLINERQSPIAKGWTIAGVKRSNWGIAGDQSYIMSTDGAGSAQLYGPVACFSWGCNWPTTPGVFANSLYLNSAPNQGEVDAPDSSKDITNPGGYQIEHIGRYLDTTTYTYDASNRVNRIYDSYRMYNGAHTYWEIEYGAHGIDSIIEPGPLGQTNQGRRTAIVVDSLGLLRSWTDADGAITKFGYDAQQRLDSIVDRKGNITVYTYDPVSWKLTSVISPPIAIDSGSTGSTVTKSLTTTYQTWQTVSVPTTATSQTNLATPIRTDSIWGTVTSPSGASTMIQADRWGQPTSTKDALGLVTTMQYDANGFVTSVTFPSGVVNAMQHTGPFLTMTQPSGQDPVYYAYGAFGQVDSSYGDAISTTEYFRGPRGRVDSLKTNDTAAVYFTYDSLYRIIKSVDALGHTTTLHYDVRTGNLDTMRATPSNRYIYTAYDRWGRDSADRVTGSSATVTKLYDSENRIIQLWDGVHANPTIYKNDPLHLYEIIDPANNAHQFAYNTAGWLTTYTDPAGKTVTTTYNTQGRPATVTNRRGQRIAYFYDKIGRDTLVRRPAIISTEPDTVERYAYSLKGDVVVASNPVSIDTTYMSLGAGWVDSTVTRFPATSRRFKRYYHHTPVNQIDSIAITSGASFAFFTRHFHWNTLTGLLDSLWVSGTPAVQFGYDGDFRHNVTVFNPTVTRTDTISDVNTILQTAYSNSINASLYQAYSYDSVGRLAERDNADQTSEFFAYNGLGQIASRQVGTWVDTIPCKGSRGPDGYPCQDITKLDASQKDSYAYDLGMNLDTLKESVHNVDTIGVAQTGNRLSSWGAYTLGNDNDGDRQSTSGAASVTYTWGADGRLLQVASNGTTLTYDYNAYGRIVRRSRNGTPERYYLWDADQLIAELDGTANNRVVEYAYYPGRDLPFANISAAGTVRYYNQDAASNVTGLIGDTSLVQWMRYDPWGNVEAGWSTTGDTNTTHLRWKGLLYEGDITKLYYARARWYDPITRRFLSEDPAQFGGSGNNFYAFAGSDPVNGRDPSGLDDGGDGGDGGGDGSPDGSVPGETYDGGSNNNCPPCAAGLPLVQITAPGNPWNPMDYWTQYFINSIFGGSPGAFGDFIGNLAAGDVKTMADLKAAAKAAAAKNKGLVDALKKFGSCAAKDVKDQAKAIGLTGTLAYGLRPLIPAWPTGASGFIKMAKGATQVETEMGLMDLGGGEIIATIVGSPWAITAIGSAALLEAAYLTIDCTLLQGGGGGE